MRILHTSDWHIGIRIGEYNLIDEQRYALQQIINIARNEHPDAIIVAGDVYDRAVPSAEAVMLFDEILVELASLKTEVFIIAGNHDSAERLAYAAHAVGGAQARQRRSLRRTTGLQQPRLAGRQTLPLKAPVV